MSRRQGRFHMQQDHDDGSEIRERLVWIVAGVIAALVVAMVIVGVLQSAWVVAHRGEVIGLLGLALLFVIASIPIVVEFNTHPRQLSGPGHNPKWPNIPKL